eukprot:TRINITY_DN267_c0_g1_i12.p1 TRINITY_DN267_c0_g1~~TRINITY_DN267_c0_g1_i12.p1  ORF type:complete len:574 (-),score=88.47 TRINITY_DN267_c0_g1_i12:370-2091(-)
MWKLAYTLFIIACEAGVIIAYGRGSNFVSKGDDTTILYPMFQDIHVMVFIGFGFLMVFLKKHSWSSVAINMFVAAWSIQIYILFKFMWVSIWEESNMNVLITTDLLIQADFAAAAVLISFGAVLGKVTAFQMFILAIIETYFYSINERILYYSIMVTDLGGTMVIHTFGAFFGLAVSAVFSKKNVNESKNLGDSYTNNLVAMVGTIFLWMYWPSFNGALSPVTHIRERAIQNTYLGLTASCIGAFIMSGISGKDGKFKMEDILNATLSAGVSLGCSCDMINHIWVSILVGFVIGIVSVIGFRFITPKLNNAIHDTCGVLNLHGIPGFYGFLVSAIIIAGTKDKYFKFYKDGEYYEGLMAYIDAGQNTQRYAGRSIQKQAGYQVLGGVITIGIALGSGIVTGLILKLFESPKDDQLFNDDAHFEVEPEFLKISVQAQDQQALIQQQQKPIYTPQGPNFIHQELQQKEIELQVDEENTNINVKNEKQTKVMGQQKPVASQNIYNSNQSQVRQPDQQPLVQQQGNIYQQQSYVSQSQSYGQQQQGPQQVQPFVQQPQSNIVQQQVIQQQAPQQYVK